MKITFERKCEQLKVFINGHLHLFIKLADLIAVRAYIDGSKEFYIEFHYPNTKVVALYEYEKLWTGVLAVVNKNIGD